ncbi:MAG: ECF transporter S component [Bacilli bacterium]
MKKQLKYLIIFLIIPLIIFISYMLFRNKHYGLLSMIVAFMALIPFILSFENRKPKAEELVIIAVIISINVVSRIIFASVPHFKPVTAIIIIAALAFGKETGFMIGMLSAVLSNFYFGQGPWTPFQMFSWGMIGYIAGIFKDKQIIKNIAFILLLGILGAVIFTGVVEVWTVLQIDQGFNFAKYLTILLASTPILIVYILSNCIFIFILAKPLLEIFNRAKNKYGIFLS